MPTRRRRRYIRMSARPPLSPYNCLYWWLPSYSRERLPLALRPYSVQPWLAVRRYRELLMAVRPYYRRARYVPVAVTVGVPNVEQNPSGQNSSGKTPQDKNYQDKIAQDKTPIDKKPMRQNPPRKNLKTKLLETKRTRTKTHQDKTVNVFAQNGRM